MNYEIVDNVFNEDELFLEPVTIVNNITGINPIFVDNYISMCNTTNYNNRKTNIIPNRYNSCKNPYNPQVNLQFK